MPLLARCVMPGLIKVLFMDAVHVGSGRSLGLI
jgi:hypothetical protein